MPTLNEQTKAKPIIFNAAEVRAIISGAKTQFRRPVEPQPDGPGPSHWYFHESEGWWTCGNNSGRMWRCPFGGVGDVLWAKETFKNHRPPVLYKADDPDATDRWWPASWMKPFESRISLRITDVRVERLQEISRNDLVAEGTWAICEADRTIQDLAVSIGLSDKRHAVELIDYFAVIWNRIDAKKHPWASNPWVWARTFQLVTVEGSVA